MTKWNRARVVDDPVIREILESISPLEMEKTGVRMSISARIDDFMQRAGIGKTELARKMSKRPSEISKWLSGTHNFTVETLTEIAMALDVKVSWLLYSGDEMRKWIAEAEIPEVNPAWPPLKVVTEEDWRPPQAPDYMTTADEVQVASEPPAPYRKKAKAKPDTKDIDPGNIKLMHIEVLHHTLTLPRNIRTELKDLRHTLQVKRHIKPEEKQVVIIVQVIIQTMETGEVVATFSVSFIYAPDRFDEAIRVAHPADYYISSDIAALLDTLSISAMRGIMFSELKGTFLHHALLPLVKELPYFK